MMRKRKPERYLFRLLFLVLPLFLYFRLVYTHLHRIIIIIQRNKHTRLVSALHEQYRVIIPIYTYTVSFPVPLCSGNERDLQAPTVFEVEFVFFTRGARRRASDGFYDRSLLGPAEMKGAYSVGLFTRGLFTDDGRERKKKKT